MIVKFIVDYPDRISIEQAKAIANILNPRTANSDSKSKPPSSREYTFSKYNPRKYPKRRVEYCHHVRIVYNLYLFIGF